MGPAGDIDDNGIGENIRAALKDTPHMKMKTFSKRDASMYSGGSVCGAHRTYDGYDE